MTTTNPTNPTNRTGTHITNVSLVTVYVTDQDEAKRFYVDVLGFEEGTDVTMGDGFRWCTVRHPDHPEIDLTLMVPGPPLDDEMAEVVRRSLAKGRMGGVGLSTSDCHKTYEELVARIHAVLRRTQPPRPDRLAAGPLALDRATRRVTVRGLPVALAAKEFELLAKLATQPTRVFTTEELLREVWGFVALGRTRTLDSHASRLRRKLALAGAEDCVLNVWGVGYRLLGEEDALRQTA